ncbi:MAG: hypothetical protein IJF54_07165 [Clostridia bacterium]|nr:hypothetical protein [Clostridia bacterium]
MKKILAMILAMVVVVSVCSCSEQTSQSDEGTTTTQTTVTTTAPTTTATTITTTTTEPTTVPTTTVSAKKLIEDKFYFAIPENCEIVNCKIEDDFITAKLNIENTDVVSIKQKIDESYIEIKSDYYYTLPYKKFDINISDIEWGFEECHTYEGTGEDGERWLFANGRIYAIYAKAKNDTQNYLYLYRSH